MNSIQRAWRSVIRKPVKSFLLFLTVFVISLFLTAGLASKSASIKTQDTARQAVGAGFRLDCNETNRSRRVAEISERIGEGKEGSLEGVHQKKMETAYGTQWIGWTDNSFDSLRLSDIEKLAAVEGISDYNITTCATAVHPVNFDRIEDPDNDQTKDLGGVTLLGNRKMELHSQVLSGNITIQEGRMATADDEDVCVISKELAGQGGLKVGDVLKFNDYHDPEQSPVYEARIIGIYGTKQFMSPLMSGDTFRSENVIFTDLRFPEKPEGEEGEPCYEHAYFQVEDVKQYDTVKKAMEETDIDWERYDFIDRNGDFATMSSNFKELEKISGLFIIVTFIAGFILLYLIFLFWVKNRSRESGILISLGFGKGNVLGQILLEAVLMAALAFFASLIAGPGVSKAFAGYLVNQQEEQAEIQKSMDEDKVAKDFEESEQTVTGVEVSVTKEMLALCGAGTGLLVTVSVGMAGIVILRKKPMEILSE